MNSTQIDNTSYYRLPCGKYLEDFIWANCLNFAEGSALKYYYRAGKKDGESTTKDMDKFMHYCRFIAKQERRDVAGVVDIIQDWYDQAIEWEG